MLSDSDRLPAPAGQSLDRSRAFTFRFDGREFQAHPGDTIASALAAAGVKVFSRSFKYHRPRGLLCVAGQCPNCLVQVGDEPNVRACRRVAEPGLRVRHQNAWPSLRLDVMSLTRFFQRFLPVGFYYKAFIRPRLLWPLYERVLRRAAGLGRVRPDPEHAPQASPSKRFVHTDVVVVGGGPAGLSAALAAARPFSSAQGARVALCDENPVLGGHLRFSGAAPEAGAMDLPGLVAAVQSEPNITVFSDTTVLGAYQDHWLPAQQGGRLLKIRARAVVVATGAIELPLVFEGNDLPGVMLGSAVQRLVRLYGVRPGRRALVVTANDDGWQVADDLLAAGVQLAAVADEREPAPDRLPPAAARLQQAGVPVYWGQRLETARGADLVTGAVIAPVAGGPGAGGRRALECDLIAVSAGWVPALDLLYQSGGRGAYDESRGQVLPDALPPGVFVAGRAAGTHALSATLAEAALAGQAAAAYLGLGSAPEAVALERAAGFRAGEPRRTTAGAQGSGHGKRFICFCEEVTDHDLQDAVAEGYDSLELLKRYSTHSMGPCQGKMCAHNAIQACARLTGLSAQAIGTTTSRQPFVPVPLSTLAGQHMEPVQRTAIHDWHAAHGARWTLAGLWQRPLHYGDPLAEVKAVREGAGLIDVSTLGKLAFGGPGAAALLDRLYINRMSDLAVGRVRYGVMCNDEAVVLDDGVAARLSEDEWYVTTTTSGASAMFETIQWWMQSGWGEGMHLTDVAEAYAAFNLAGPQARAALQPLTSIDLSNAAFPYMAVRQGQVAGVPCRVLRIGFTGELSYEIHVPAAYGLHVWEVLMRAGEPFGLIPFGLEAQRVLRLEKGHIIISQDTDALTDPLAAGLGWAVKMDKADFLGRRSLARLQAEGPRQRLTGFKMARPGVVPDEGVQVVQAAAGGRHEILGYVTSCRFSPTLNETIGLCWLPADLAGREGASFTIRLRNGSGLEEARVHHGPFYDPKGERLRS